MPKHWPDHLPVVQMRIARPTGQFERVVAFDRDGLGLPIVYSYLDDADYDGVIFRLPGKSSRRRWLEAPSFLPEVTRTHCALSTTA